MSKDLDLDKQDIWYDNEALEILCEKPGEWLLGHPEKIILGLVARIRELENERDKNE